ncbi:carboxymuconolactone decarboxylase family protein [Fructilactobacillus florum]|uniref:carboxymuconolactone decarboxylase family protein n=1 Tax=Fructilactobacillus florum TaxID=640331 RepID=UPI002E1A8372
MIKLWSREDKLSPKNRSLVTVTSLISQEIFGPLKFHIPKVKDNGVSKDEMVEAITKLAFYSTWIKTWTAMLISKEIYDS